MGVVTDIRKQKVRLYFNVYVDGKFAFSASPDNIVNWGIKTGKEISSEKIKELTESSDFQKNLDRVFGFLSVRPRSTKELENYFKRKKMNDDVGKKILEKVSEYGYANDRDFAKWWVEQRQAHRPKSKRVLKMELAQKGISREIIDEIGDEGMGNDKKTALDLIAKKIERWKVLPSLDLRKKITNYLGNRGFSWDIIKEVVDQYLQR